MVSWSCHMKSVAQLESVSSFIKIFTFYVSTFTTLDIARMYLVTFFLFFYVPKRPKHQLTSERGKEKKQQNVFPFFWMKHNEIQTDVKLWMKREKNEGQNLQSCNAGRSYVKENGIYDSRKHFFSSRILWMKKYIKTHGLCDWAEKRGWWCCFSFIKISIIVCVRKCDAKVRFLFQNFFICFLHSGWKKKIQFLKKKLLFLPKFYVIICD